MKKQSWRVSFPLLVLALLAVPLQGQVGRASEEEILGRLKSNDFEVWAEAVYEAIGSPRTAAIRAALIEALERDALWGIQRRERKAPPLSNADDEFRYFLLEAVIRLKDPRAVRGLAWKAHTGNLATNALLDFGNTAVGALLEVAMSPEASGEQVRGVLWVLAVTIEREGRAVLSKEALAEAREAAILHLVKGPPKNYVSAWSRDGNLLGAVDLAGVLRDPVLLERLEVLAKSTPEELVGLGIRKDYIDGFGKWIRQCAAARLAGTPASVSCIVPGRRRGIPPDGPPALPRP